VARREIRKKIASINQWEEAPDRESDRQKKKDMCINKFMCVYMHIYAYTFVCEFVQRVAAY